jgi:hypothetical protein
MNRDKELKWFEHDVIAYSPDSSKGDLQLLIECKYHDESRFWFFLPCEIEDLLAQYSALSAGENLHTDAAVLHSAPYELLSQPSAETLLRLAPKCVWGVTVSQDGARQPNTVEEAAKQLGFGFVPFCLENFYEFNRSSAVCILPVIVTSARLFRLRSEITTLGTIRAANAPADIADELPWLWYYHAPNGELLGHNLAEVDAYKKRNRYARRKTIANQLAALWSFPHWIAVINITALPMAVDVLYQQFLSLAKNFSGDRLIKTIWEDRGKRRAKGPRARRIWRCN